MNPEYEVRRYVAEEAARTASAVHLHYRGQSMQRDVKGDRSDYATRVDLESQAAARDAILRAFPGETVVGEEDAPPEDELSRLLDSGCWLIDPLDGTLEYVHNHVLFSCIVSYVQERRTLACAVHFGVLGELYSASLGGGPSLNGIAIRTSGQQDLEAAVLATTYRSTRPERARDFGDALAGLLPQIEAFRIPGAPSLAACYLAAGRYDLYSLLGSAPGPEAKPQPWEQAAFILLVAEAGGAVVSPDGGPADPMRPNVYAATPELLEAYLGAFGGGGSKS